MFDLAISNRQYGTETNPQPQTRRPDKEYGQMNRLSRMNGVNA